MNWIDPRIEELRKLGARIADGVYLGTNVYIERDFAPLLTVEQGVVISHGVSIILHDSALNNVAGEPILFGFVTLRERCYIGVNTTLLCGVDIGAGALIGASSLVTNDVPAGAVAYGQPARVQGTVTELIERQRHSRRAPRRFFTVDLQPWRDRDDQAQAAALIEQAIHAHLSSNA